MSTNNQQKKIERAERQEPEADLVASWVPPVPSRWSAGFDYQLDLPEDVRRAIRGLDVFPVVHVLGRGRAEWAVLAEDGKTITARLAGIDLRQVIIRLHRLPRS